MNRELIRGQDKGCWQSYIITSRIGNDKYFQGSIELPFNKESEANSKEIIKLITQALKQPGVEK